jgi:MFS family permease
VADRLAASPGLRFGCGLDWQKVRLGWLNLAMRARWVITSYLAANAIILPISGWLSAHLGRRNYFLLSIAIFTVSSGLCGMATSLGQLIIFGL